MFRMASRLFPVLGLIAFFSAASAADRNEQLIEAASTGELETVKTLVAHGADPNARNHSGDTVITFLLMQILGYNDTQQIETMRWLLSHGAQVNLRDTNGNSPLILAAGHGGNVEQSDGQLAAVKLLLDSGADVNAATDELKLTALHWAAYRGYLGAIRLLLDHGADKSLRNSYGETPLAMMKQNSMLDKARQKEITALLSK